MGKYVWEHMGWMVGIFGTGWDGGAWMGTTTTTTTRPTDNEQPTGKDIRYQVWRNFWAWIRIGIGMPMGRLTWVWEHGTWNMEHKLGMGNYENGMMGPGDGHGHGRTQVGGRLVVVFSLVFCSGV
jgi:hypothetical protein